MTVCSSKMLQSKTISPFLKVSVCVRARPRPRERDRERERELLSVLQLDKAAYLPLLHTCQQPLTHC